MIALTGLVLLAAGLALAGEGQAEVKEVQTYVWGNLSNNNGDSDPDLDWIQHRWVPTPHEIQDDRPSGEFDGTDNITVIPRDGFILVGVRYTATSASEVQFSLIELDSSSEIGEDPAEHVYTYKINDQARQDQPEDDRNVWLATGNIELDDQAGYFHAFSSTTMTGSDGCGDLGNSLDLSSGTPNDGGDPCWFLVDVTNPDGDGSLSEDNEYAIEVEVDGDTLVERMDDDDESDVDSNDPPRFLLVEGSTFKDNSLSIRLEDPVQGPSDTVLEVDQPFTFNLTVELEDETSDEDREIQFGDVDAWLCLFRNREANDPEEPYTGFGDFKTDKASIGPNDGWDNPVACEFMDYPTHDGNADANAVNLSNDNTNEQNVKRYFQKSLEVRPGELEITSGEFVDNFFFRVTLRDPIGNIEVHDQTSSNPGNVTVARYDPSQDLANFTSPKVPNLDLEDFDRNQDCHQPSNLIPAGSDATNPCFRAEDLTPPYDDPFTFEVTLKNFANVRDEIELSWEKPANNVGQTGWTVQLEGPDGSSMDSISVAVPAASLQTSDGAVERNNVSPGERTVTVEITPSPSTTLAGPATPTRNYGEDSGEQQGQRTIQLRTDSAWSEVSTVTPRYLQAQLIQNAQGAIAFPADDDADDRIELQAPLDETTDVDVTIENTGNTNGPFALRKAGGDPTCLPIGDPADPNEIELQLEETNSFTIPPEGTRTVTLEVTPGQNVPIGSYECELGFTTGSGIQLVTDDPTIVVTVTGTPDIRFLDVRGAEFDEANATGKNLTFKARPDAENGYTDVYIYMENTGDVALEPELIGGQTIFRQADDVGGAWYNVHRGGTANLTRTDAPFQLPVSDADEDTIDVSDIFTTERSLTTPEVDQSQNDDPWWCGGIDGPDGDNDERVVCQLHLRYDFSSKNAATGDEVVYRFKYADAGGAGNASQVNVHLDFGHVGTIDTTAVSEKILTTDQSSQPSSSNLVFEATLEDGARFGPDPTSVSSDVFVDVTSQGDCQGTIRDIQSSQEEPRRATFRPSVEVRNGGSCEVAQGADTDILVTVPTVNDPQDIAVNLTVRDENGTTLRQTHPVHLRVIDGSVSEVSAPDGFNIQPGQSLDATGDQFARLVFDVGDDDTDYPTGGEGLLLTRKSTQNALNPFSSLDLDGQAIEANGDSSQLNWSVLNAVDANFDVALEYNKNSDDQHTVPANRTIAGLLFTNDDSGAYDTPMAIGNVTLWGWDSDDSEDDGFNWTEGWNPIVLRVVDSDGDPLRDADADDTTLDLELRFVVRENTNGDDTIDANDQITDAYELSSDDGSGAIHVRSLGNGFFAADIYIPAGGGGTESIDLPSATLGDYNTTDGVEVEDVRYQAFGLHARISSAKSTGGTDLAGDAYWQLDDLGLVSDSNGPSDAAGTIGASDIASGIIDEPEPLTTATIGDDDTGNYLHAAPRFLAPMMEQRASADADWRTGPGVHDYQVFLLNEEAKPDSDEDRFNGSGSTTEDFRDHTVSPYTSARVNLTIAGADGRLSLPGSDTYTLEADDERDGAYRSFVVLPDTGREIQSWFTDLKITEDQDDGRQFFRVVQTVETDAQLEPASNGLAMPLALSKPVGWTPDEQDPAGDFDRSELGDQMIVDLRTVPGLLPDRGGFAMVPLVETDDASAEGIHFQVDSDATFTVQGDSLLSLDESQLPTTGEIGRSTTIKVSPTPTSAVEMVTASLVLNGSEESSTTLSGPVDGVWTGTVTPQESGDYTLRVEAVDTSGGVEPVTSTMTVRPNSPPSITIASPSATAGTRAMSSSGTIQATIEDNRITADAITVFEKTASDDGASGSALSAGDVSVTGLTTEATPGTKSITVEVDGQEGSTAYVNVSNADGSQTNLTGVLDDANQTSGSIELNGTGTATMTVEAGGTVSESFTITVSDGSGDGFSQASLGADAIDCQGTTCDVSWSPSGLSDGDTLVFKINATVDLATDDFAETSEVTVEVDDTDPSGSISVGTPKASGTPTRVGTGTSLTVTASDNVLVGSMTVGARQGGAEVGTRSFQGGQAEVSGETSLSQLGVTTSGTVKLNVTVRDIAGNAITTQREVLVDTRGPQIANADASASGSNVEISASISDDAGVEQAQVFAKKPGEVQFTARSMTKSGGTYAATITSPGGQGTLEYYIRAEDALGNAGTLAGEDSPRTVDLGQFDLTNAAPTVEITSPADGADVSGTFDVEVQMSDPDTGDTLTIESVRVDPSTGDSVSVDLPAAGETVIPVNSSALSEGRAIIEVEVSDGTDTATATRTVIVNNLPDAGACDAETPLRTGDEVEVCFTYPSDGNVTGITVNLIRNGETVGTQTLGPSQTGQYRTTFSIGEEGSYALSLTAEKSDGTTEETTTEPFQVQSALPGVTDEPLGRFVTTLVLGVVTIGLAAFAGFRRWA